ncbi:MAG: hypothetical protein ACUVTB_05610 [Candidatus Bathycorpusculaceae bacterium]
MLEKWVNPLQEGEEMLEQEISGKRDGAILIVLGFNETETTKS